MSVVLTGTASERVGGANGYIDVVTDPSKFIGRMPFKDAVVADTGNFNKPLKELLEDKGNPVYTHHKDGTKTLQEYYKADYELKLTAYMSAKKSDYNRIISREEALTQMIDEEYPDMQITDKLELAALDTKADQDKIKKLWKVQTVTKAPAQEIVKEAAELNSYPQIAEGGIPEVTPKAVAGIPPIFRRQTGMTLTTDTGTEDIKNVIDTPYCTVVTSNHLFELTQNNKYLLHMNDNTIEVVYSGLGFFDPTTNVAYTVLLK